MAKPEACTSHKPLRSETAWAAGVNELSREVALLLNFNHLLILEAKGFFPHFGPKNGTCAPHPSLMRSHGDLQVRRLAEASGALASWLSQAKSVAKLAICAVGKGRGSPENNRC